MVQTTGKAFGSGSLSGYCTRGTGAGIAPRAIASGSNIHCWDNLNDGLYGNSNSWIPRTDGDKAGVVLPAPLTIVGIQLARDLGGESGVYGDRAGGTITVEYSATANGDATPWASSSGWAVAGTVSGWAANTRNYYHFSTPVVADGLRITVTSGTCVDELEIYTVYQKPMTPPPPPSPPPPSPSPSLPTQACTYTFTSKASLKTAVQAYDADPTAATATYGPIAGWCVSVITDMSYLFHNLQNFNADISSWDTSGVTDMSWMFQVRSARSLAPKP